MQIHPIDDQLTGRTTEIRFVAVSFEEEQFLSSLAESFEAGMRIVIGAMDDDDLDEDDDWEIET